MTRRAKNPLINPSITSQMSSYAPMSPSDSGGNQRQKICRQIHNVVNRQPSSSVSRSDATRPPPSGAELPLPSSIPTATDDSNVATPSSDIPNLTNESIKSLMALETSKQISFPILRPRPDLVQPGASPVMHMKDMLETRPDSWTQTGWTVSYLLQLFDSIFQWDFMVLCLICKEPFLHDFTEGMEQCCSTGLVHSLLALVTLHMEQSGGQPQEHEEQLRGHDTNSTSRSFFDKARAIIDMGGLLHNLPDTQALGILALYQIACGNQNEAYKFAEACVRAAKDIYTREMFLSMAREGQYDQVRSTTYRGAVSLVRILRLTMIRPAEIYSGVHQDDIVSFGRTTPWSSGTNRWDRLHDLSSTAMDAHSPRSYHHQNLISAEIFYLTELVCQPRITGQTDNIMSSYKAFLNWYQNFFTLFKKKESGPPFIHCIHILYHFCLLCLFHPLAIAGSIEGTNLKLNRICLQAAHSIIALSRSFIGMYGALRTNPLLPYFVYHSGLLSLELGKSGDRGEQSDTPSPFVQSPAISSLSGIMDETGAIDTMDEEVPPTKHMTIAAQARLLLAELGVVHPSAAIRRKILIDQERGAMPHPFD